MSDQKVSELIDNHFVAITTTTTKEDAIHYFEKYDRAALPIITEAGVLVGIVTIDDIIDEIEQQTTEDIQKFGDWKPDLPYTQTSWTEMIKKRATAYYSFHFGNAYRFCNGLF